MKATKILIAITSFFIGSFIFTSCVNDNEFTVPTSLGATENTLLNSLLDSITAGTVELKTIGQVKELYTSGNNPLQLVSNIAVKGYVVSSDRTGNFFEELYIQDSPENPTSGIKIHSALRSSYNTFNLGREVYIRLKGLYLGETNSGDGVIAIGGKVNPIDTREIETISKNQIANHIFRSSITEIIIPKVVILGGINDSHIGTFVTIENAFFPTNLVGKPYVDPNETFDTHRKFKACQGFGFSNLLVETSSFSIFGNESIPAGGGTISGVISKDFRGDFAVLILNATDDVKMEGTKCTPLDILDFLPILEQDFEATSGDINSTGWTNFREAGTKSWKSYFDSDSSSRAARIGSFFSRNSSTISWLITKGVNLDATTQEFLSFETSSSFADDSELEVLISTDWNGTTARILTATWSALPATIISDSEPSVNWVHSGYVDLSTYTGTVYIAFKYTGSGDASFDGTFELDNVIINAQ